MFDDVSSLAAGLFREIITVGGVSNNCQIVFSLSTSFEIVLSSLVTVTLYYVRWRQTYLRQKKLRKI